MDYISDDPENLWYKYLMGLWRDIDNEVLKTTFRSFGLNATLIDGAFEESTDFRRGEGTFRRREKAMAILREKRLPFGVSCCYTSRNVEVHGLHHVVVYAGLEAPLLCGKVVPRCHEEDGDILIQLPDGAREIKAARGVPDGVFVFNSALAALRACSRCRAA